MAIRSLFNSFVLTISSLIFIISTCISTYFRQGLFLFGLNIVYDMQQSSGPILNIIQNLFSLLGNPFTIFSIICIQFLYFNQRIRTYVHLIYIFSGLYFMVLLKQTFQQSRPFWYDSNVSILEWFCPIDFGNPSGHSFIYIAMFQPLLTDFIGTGRKKVFIFLWAFFGIFVLISRMYLGAHSLDQVIYGGLIGLSYLVAYRFWLQNFLYRALTDLLNQKNKRLYTLVNSFLWLLFFIAPLIAYESNVRSRPINQNILSNINMKCNLSFDSQDYQKSILFSALSSFVSFGFFYGFIFLKNKKRQDSFFMAGKWSFKSQRCFFIYLIALIIVLAPSIILILLLPLIFNSAELSYTFKVLGATWAGFGLIYPMSVIQQRFSLIQIDSIDETQ